MERYYWQHEDTGRICATDFNYPPSQRWYSVSKEFYEMADDATHYGQTSTDDSIYSDEVTGAKPR